MSVRILVGDCRTMLATLEADSVHCVMTSPPYWGLRDYGIDGQLGMETTLEGWLAGQIDVFRAVRRVLRPDGTVWLNVGDAYATEPAGWSAKRYKAHGKDDRTHRDKPFSTISPRLKSKQRLMLPARLALALQADGWWLRDEIVWAKPNPMPSSVKDRTTPAHEMLYLLTKSARYHYDHKAIAEPLAASSHERIARPGVATDQGGPKTAAFAAAGLNARSGSRTPADILRNVSGNKAGVPRSQRGRPLGGGAAIKGGVPWPAPPDLMRHPRSVWTIGTKAFPEAHFATFPPALVEPCIKAGCPVGGTVLDPFFGAGTVGLVAERLQRHTIGIELNPKYADMARRRLAADARLLTKIDEAAE